MLSFKKILCPSDFSAPSLEALSAARDMAKVFGAELLLLHVVAPVPVVDGPAGPAPIDASLYDAEMEKAAKKNLEEICAKYIPESIKTHLLVGLGNAAQEILRVAEEKCPDLIVIATHGESGWRHLFFGSVAEKVVRHALSPVLVVHAPRERT